MNKKRLLRFGIIGLFMCLSAGAGAVGGMLLTVRASIRANCAIAQSVHAHTGDNVAALIDYLKDESRSYRERNQATWTLGQIADTRALPALEAVYTGAPCDHSRFLCQYELEKAIKRCGGTPSPPRQTRRAGVTGPSEGAGADPARAEEADGDRI